ncbi:MAG TPA: FoF1 ATP synthase subunit a [Limnochordia bacterium]|jgi:F-type H+-transporting ATPase subunit a|nr:FoF1 ATP synthase subunit a [Bacillota bacterium]HOB10004.1 FoF1 ATP synthase subunit a [Limnochordia bacterium]HPZ32003.1 FoF1 ATP synthase subunit a [Limnochordia bacterium]HQD71724.1 FoF1 ATP synthase subunit a [Limnochordia bacterium]
MDLNIKNLWVVYIGGVEIWITETIVNTWIIMAILILLAVIARIRMTRFSLVPRGFQNVIETVVELFDNFAAGALGSSLSYIAPWFFMVFAFILSSSLFSVFGLRAPTADWATTFTLAFATFILMLFMGFRHRKGGYLKSFFGPHPIFFPLNLIGELAKPVSLSFRLFGNMLSGTIILAIYYQLTPWLVQIGIPALMHAFFDVVIGALQTYIFVFISFMYIRGAAADN